MANTNKARKFLIFTIHNTTAWWRYIGDHLNFADECVILSDLRGDGDVCVVDDFYKFLKQGNAKAKALEVYGKNDCAEIIRRCRVLRSLDETQALEMIGAMHQALEIAIDDISPIGMMTYTMDRYIMDLIDRIGAKRGIPLYEMTVSILPDHIMLLQRGRPVFLQSPTDEQVEKAVDTLAVPDFTPSYVQQATKFTLTKFWKIFLTYELRGAVFNIFRFLKNDPLNLHYLDARKNLKHKVRVSDVNALKLIDHNWQDKLEKTDKDKRVFIGLALFPEASIDYWLENMDFVEHDDAMERITKTLSDAGYHIFFKDHPLQYGFRQKDLFERVAKIPNVSIVPYDVPANYMMSHCPISVTFTGTIGFQAALMGNCSIVADPYYRTDEDFIQIKTLEDIDRLPELLDKYQQPKDLDVLRARVAKHLLTMSLPGDYFTWKNFDKNDASQCAKVQSLIDSLNASLPNVIEAQTAKAA